MIFYPSITMYLRLKFKKYNSFRKNDLHFSFCLAPFNAMHFTFTGKVYPCHNNNSIAYGDVGKESLKEIWSGKSRLFYKNKMKKYQLKETGCLQCLMDIKQNNFQSVNSLRYDAFTNKMDDSYPSIMGFRFSDRCNIQCIMCLSNHNIRNTQIDSTSIYNDSFFEDLKEFIPHLKHAYFLGGEPFFENLNYRVFDLLSELNPECDISVQTNGMILNERVRKLLELGKYNINVSIDSLNSETFEFIRQGAKFEQVMKNIKEFKDYCKAKNTSFSSCISPMRVNYKDIPSVINHYNEQNDIIWINKYYFPAKYAIWSMSSVEIKNIIEELSMVILMDINDTSKYNNEQFSGFLKILVSQYIDAVKRETITIDFQKEVIKLIKNCNKLLDNFKGISNEDVSKAKESLEYIQDSNSKKLYFYLKFLLEIFSGDKLAENLNIINKEFIKNDLESISI